MGPAADLIDRVALILREVSAEAIEPRFGALASGDVRSKAPGELVTIADEEAEELLAKRLGGLLPGTPVVGEEACASDPDLIRALNGDRAWLVDPLDGTANFVAGSPDWAVMVALVDRGATVASWIWRPLEALMYVAESGAGATRNGSPLRRSPASPDASNLRGAMLRRFLDGPTQAAVDRNTHCFAEVTGGARCAGVDYPAVLDGLRDFVLFWRTEPWDHAPGALLADESGTTVRRLDGSSYRPTQTAVGLLVAADDGAWSAARRILDVDHRPHGHSPPASE